MSDTIMAVHEVRIDNIEKILGKILACVKETNGHVINHGTRLATIEEWKRGADYQFKKLENRVWVIVAGGTLIGTVAGNIINLLMR